MLALVRSSRPAVTASAAAYLRRGFSTKDSVPPNLSPLAQGSAAASPAAGASAAPLVEGAAAGSKLTKDSRMNFILQFYKNMPKGEREVPLKEMGPTGFTVGQFVGVSVGLAAFGYLIKYQTTLSKC